jgi:ATP-dependent Clp protease ATP-binding subunit ClpA
MHVIEQGLLSGAEIDDMQKNPMFANMGSKDSKREDSQTPALDFFCNDITREANEGKIDPII